MWDTALVIVVVAACVVLLGRTLYRQLAGKGSCGCSCSSGSCTPGKSPTSGCGCPPPEKKE